MHLSPLLQRIPHHSKESQMSSRLQWETKYLMASVSSYWTIVWTWSGEVLEYTTTNTINPHKFTILGVYFRDESLHREIMIVNTSYSCIFSRAWTINQLIDYISCICLHSIWHSTRNYIVTYKVVILWHYFVCHHIVTLPSCHIATLSCCNILPVIILHHSFHVVILRHFSRNTVTFQVII